MKYTSEGDHRRFMTLFNRDGTVGELLDLVRDKMQRDDLCAVLKDGFPLPLQDTFDQWYSPDAHYHVVSQNSCPAPPEPRSTEKDQGVVILHGTKPVKPTIVRVATIHVQHPQNLEPKKTSPATP